MLWVGVAERVIFIIVIIAKGRFASRGSSRRRRRRSSGGVYGRPTTLRWAGRWWWRHSSRCGRLGKRRGNTAIPGTSWGLKRVLIGGRAFIHARVSPMTLQGVLVFDTRCNICIVVTIIFCDLALNSFTGLARRGRGTGPATSRGPAANITRRGWRRSPSLRRGRRWWACRDRWWLATEPLLRSERWGFGG